MEESDLSALCRLCVQLSDREKVSPIFHNEMYEDKISLPERIKYCSSVEVIEGDGLPPQICATCLLKLNQSFVFRNQCVLADITLRHLVKDVSCSVEELPNLLKVDIENQIIKSEYDKCFQEKDVLVHPEEANNKKNETSLDEFDNSKNGRHKQSINKSKDKVKKQVEIFKVKNEPKADDDKFKCSKVCTKNKRGTSKNKTLVQENDFDGMTKNHITKKNENLSKVKKEVNVEKDKSLKIEPEEKSEDIFQAVESDLFTFDRNSSCNAKNNSLELTFEKCQKKAVTKTVKPKTLGMKKTRKRKSTVAKEKPSSYTCDYCHKVYPSEGGWRYHIHTMHNENYQPFICDLCGQTFKVKKNLEGHKNSVHFHLKLHLCDLCGRGFASKYALKVHKIWHSDEKNYSCDICGTKFRTRGKMNTHRSIHGGPKKFMCHICSRDFRWKKDFEIHMRTHTGEKPFKCSHCGKAFASPTNMKKHERNHLRKTLRNCESFEPVTSFPDDRLHKNDFLDFGYGSEDVRNRQINQI